MDTAERMSSSLSPERPTYGWAYRHARVLLAIAWIVVAGASAVALVDAHNRSRAGLEARVQLRTELTGRFVGSYVSSFIRQERKTAQRRLSDPVVDRAAFEDVVDLFGIRTAVLLDDEGNALGVTPRDASLVGTNLSAKYDHLRTALGGQPAVSSIVPSAADGKPVIAFAVPFDTPSGRRVFSGAFDVTATPFASYLRRAATLAPNRIYLIDGAGGTITTNDPGSVPPVLPGLPAEPGAMFSSASHTSEGDYLSAKSIAGTPWYVELAYPQYNLYASIEGFQRWLPWMLWLGFALGGLFCIVLVGRLIRRREALDRLAHVDVLTGVANRRATGDALDSALANAKRHGHSAGILLIDVDGLKALNDTKGHAAGDGALQLVANCLRAEVRDGEMVGRWGGDEFLVVMNHADEEGAAVLGARLVERVERAASGSPGRPARDDDQRRHDRERWIRGRSRGPASRGSRPLPRQGRRAQSDRRRSRPGHQLISPARSGPGAPRSAR